MPNHLATLSPADLQRLRAVTEPSTVNAIRSRLEPGHSSSGLYRTLTKLMARNLITRYPHAAENQSHLYEITALGAHHLKDVPTC